MVSLNSVILEGEICSKPNDFGTVESPGIEFLIRSTVRPISAYTDREAEYDIMKTKIVVPQAPLARSIREAAMHKGTKVRVVGHLVPGENEHICVLAEHVEIRHKRGIQMEHLDAQV